MDSIDLTIDSRPEGILLASMRVKQMVADYFTETKLLEIEQALSEAINNCIEHAYRGSGEHQITLKYTLSTEGLLIDIIDQGEPFDVAQLKNTYIDFDYDPIDIDNLPEGGLGLKIIKVYMDEVHYLREDGNNHWSLMKYC